MSVFARVKAKWLIISLIATGLLVLVGIYGVWSVMSWQVFEKQMAVTTQTSEGIIERLRTEPLTVDTFDSLHRTMVGALAKDTCSLPGLVAWQTMVLSRQSMVDSCHQAQELAKRRAGALQQVQQHAAGEAALGAAIKTASDKLATTEPTDYEAMMQVWQQAKLAIAKETGAVAKVTTALSEKVDAIIAAFGELHKANGAKDRKAFDSAQDKVGQAYGALLTIQDTATAVYTEKINALLVMY